MNKKYYLDDGLKADALKLMDSPPFKDMILVLRNRIPDYGNSTEAIHTIAAQAKLREGYEMAIDTLLNLINESAIQQSPDMESVLLDPRD